MVHPFSLMDSAVDHFCKDNGESVREVYRRIISSVRKVYGRCEFIWHERFIAGDMPGNDWDRIFQEVTSEAS